MPSPLVSVVMPVYNCQQFLPQAIESILNQTYKNFELIIIDDGSTDGSKEIIKKYQKIDDRIKIFFNKQNFGQSRTIKKAISFLKGKYFMKLDNDDVFDQKKIERQVAFFEEKKDYVVLGNQIEIIDEQNRIVGYRNYPISDFEIRKALFYKSPFAYPSICIRLSFLKKVTYPTYFYYADDYYLWFKLLKLGKGHNLNQYLLKYRIRKNQVKSKKLKLQLQETITVQKLIFQQSQKIPLKAYFYHFLHKLLLFLPPQLILWLFMKIEYKKRP